MSYLRRLSGTTALVTLMTGSAAFADVSAQQVWGDWKSYMEGFGYEVTGTEAANGNTLSVTDLNMKMQLPEASGQLAVSMPQMNFVDRGDGTVEIALPDSMPVMLAVAPETGEKVDLTLNYTNNGLQMIVSGTPEEMTYNYSGAAVGMQVTSLVVDGKAIPIRAAEISIKDLSGTSVMKTGNLRDITQSMKAGSVTYNLDMNNPDDANEFVKIAGMLNGLDFGGSGAYPMAMMRTDDMNALMQAGFAFSGAFTHSGGNMNFEFVDGQEGVNAQTSSQSGKIAVSMSADGINYDVATNGLSVNFAGGDVPFPVAFQMAESGFNFAMPVSKSDESKPFAMGFKLGGFTMSDMLWGIFDPAGQLPRDPATIALDLTGQAKLGFDLMDPKQMEAVERGEMGMPGEVESLKVNTLEVTAAGASLTGTGDFAFDFPTIMQSEGEKGIDGVLNLNLTGANGLMDKLVAMGLLPQEQAMGARMMMGMFAVPGDGEDALKSKLEVKPGGEILANGQRIK